MLIVNIRKILLLQASLCLSTNELANKAEVPRSTVSSVINGKRNPTPRTIGLLAKALGVEASELLIDGE